MPDSGSFITVADQFGIAIAVLLLFVVGGTIAFIKEMVVPGAALRRAIKRGDEFERLFKLSVGFNEQQLATNSQVAQLAELIADRMAK